MKQDLGVINNYELKDHIYTIRGKQVMIDSDLAKLYGVENKRLNEQVKRNIKRFPDRFRFQISNEEFQNLRSQFATSSTRGGRRYLPYAFTEQGISMLSAVLGSEVAIEISIKIMDAFVGMRKFISNNTHILQRLLDLEKGQFETNTRFEKIFKAIEEKNIKHSEGIFFNGKIFDAYTFICDLIKSANKSIVLIDNYIDETVLILFSKRVDNCVAFIYTGSISDELRLDLQKHNQQYPDIVVKVLKNIHDRFLILDGEIIYHFGASIKDLGKKISAFSKFDKKSLELLKDKGVEL